MKKTIHILGTPRALREAASDEVISPGAIYEKPALVGIAVKPLSSER